MVKNIHIFENSKTGMEADRKNRGKKLVVLLERDFKNERLHNLLIGSKSKLKPSVNNLLEEINEVDDAVEILAEDITDISSDDDFDPLSYKWEEDEWYQEKLQIQGKIATNNAEFEINRISSSKFKISIV